MVARSGFVLSLVAVGILGCASDGLIDSNPQNYPLVAVDGAVETAMSMGVQGYSENHREFYSRPFQIAQSDESARLGYRERGVAKVVVLGDGRPYTIEAEVSIERGKLKKDPANIKYEFNRYDKRLAKRLLSEIIAILEHRERDKNVIDDFRSF